MDMFPTAHKVGQTLMSTFHLRDSSAPNAIFLIATLEFKRKIDKTSNAISFFTAKGITLNYRIDYVLGQYLLIASVATPPADLPWDDRIPQETRDKMVAPDGTLRRPWYQTFIEMVYPLKNVHRGLLLERVEDYVKKAGGIKMLPYE